MDLHRLNDSIADMQMLTPMANFAVDPDQTVPRRAVRFGSKLFAIKTSYGQTNIANSVQATPRIAV